MSKPKLREISHAPLVAGLPKTVPPDGLLTPRQIEMRGYYEMDFFFFARKALGLDRLTEKLHREVGNFMMDVWRKPEAYSLLMIPRQCFKTTMATIAFTIWCILKQPNLRILVASSKRQFAKRLMHEIKGHLLRSEVVQELWPDVVYPDETSWKKSCKFLTDEIEVKRSYHDKVPSVSVGSVEGGTVGNHFHLIILDDLVDRDNHKTPGMREDVKDFVNEVENQLRRPDEWCPTGGRVVDIGTPWHFDDAHAMIRKKHAKQLRTYIRGIYGKPGKTDGTKHDIIFPEEFDQKLIHRKVTAMGRLVANAQMFCDARPSTQAIFKEEKFRWFEMGNEPPVMRVYTSIDPNRSEKTKNDPVAIVTAGIDAFGHIWVLDYTGGHPAGEELLEKIQAHVERWAPEQVFCEDNNYQNQIQHFARTFFARRGMYINFVPVTRGNTRKFDRITAMVPLVDSGMLHLPRNNVGQAVADELKVYEGKNDDICDALSDIFAYGSPAQDERTNPQHRRVALDPGMQGRYMADLGVMLGAGASGGDPFSYQGLSW